MTIKEVEQILEVPRATIRFYEKEGLIDPKREGNRYRDYSEEDVEQLKRIIILRKAGLPLSDISDLFDGAESGAHRQFVKSSKADGGTERFDKSLQEDKRRRA